MTDDWITDRRPLPVDGDSDGDVKVRYRPDLDESTYVHHSHVGLGTPWRHIFGWTFPQIRVGQTWRCEDGELRRVNDVGGPDTPWLIGDYWYNAKGEALGTTVSRRLAELLGEPEPEPEPVPQPEPASKPVPLGLIAPRAFHSLSAYVDSDDGLYYLAVAMDGTAWISPGSGTLVWRKLDSLPND